METYYADTYAMIEYTKGNNSFFRYFKECKIITTWLNLMELYYATLLVETEEKANEYYGAFLSKIVSFDHETIKSAAKLRFGHKKKNISYIDAIGYQIALEDNVKFLTGDKAFKGMKNVEYVK
jgi:predicted nucleic acid-binding protein